MQMSRIKYFPFQWLTKSYRVKQDIFRTSNWQRLKKNDTQSW